MTAIGLDMRSMPSSRILACSTDRQFDFWFPSSMRWCQRRPNRRATGLLLATTRFTAKTVPLLRGGVVVATHDSDGDLDGLSWQQLDLLAQRSRSLTERDDRVLSRRITRDARRQRRNVEAARAATAPRARPRTRGQLAGPSAIPQLRNRRRHPTRSCARRSVAVRRLGWFCVLMRVTGSPASICPRRHITAGRAVACRASVISVGYDVADLITYLCREESGHITGRHGRGFTANDASSSYSPQATGLNPSPCRSSRARVSTRGEPSAVVPDGAAALHSM